MLVEPSPKFQDQDVGLPVDVSLNTTVWEVTSVPGVNVKAAVGAGAGILLPLSLPVPLLHADNRKTMANAAIRKIDIKIFLIKIFLFLILSDSL